MTDTTTLLRAKAETFRQLAMSTPKESLLKKVYLNQARRCDRDYMKQIMARWDRKRTG